MRNFTLFLCVLPLIGLANLGCTRYDWRVTAPPELAGTFDEKAELARDAGQLQYRLVASENRAVVRIANPTTRPVTLLGGSSVVVDPGGQSHALRTQTIAPNSFAKIIIPPLRPQVRPGPSIGFGVGVGIGSTYHRRGYPYGGVGAYDGFPDEPAYYTVYEDDDSYYWDWHGEGAVRALLRYRWDGGEETTQELTIQRTKR
jgi:hypothetical protein